MPTVHCDIGTNLSLGWTELSKPTRLAERDSAAGEKAPPAFLNLN